MTAENGLNERRKLRVLIITMGGERQEAIRSMFSTSSCSDRFEVEFSPGVPSRSLRPRAGFFRTAHEAGLVPDVEWQAIQEGLKNPIFQIHTDRFFECLSEVPISTEGRRGSEADKKLHYSVELWRKSKGLSRERSVLACLFAHLIAIKRLVEEGFDMILEDNVRMAETLAAQRVWDTIDASEENSDYDCHLRYYGWLGSMQNLAWVLDVHRFRRYLPGAPDRAFYFPQTEDLQEANEEMEAVPIDGDDNKVSSISPVSPNGHTTPGGTLIWGAYAYWVSKSGYDALIERLRQDVGAILWKGKRMRSYVVKPIDKVLPRQIAKAFGHKNHIHVTLQPAFFRAPMLTSKIHSQWDPLFCLSTQYQLQKSKLGWKDLWLTDLEQRIVKHYEETEEWLTVGQMRELLK